MRQHARRSTQRRQPSPDFIEPCLPSLVKEAPAGDRWLHEIKWDGYRLMARVEGGKVTLRTRNGFDWTHRFPTIAEAMAALPVRTAYIDGEAVVETRGAPDFAALEEALMRGAAHKAVFWAFDLLHLEGRDLRKLPLEERKRQLGELFEPLGLGGRLRYSDHLLGDGQAIWRQACAMRLEGTIAKRRDAPYRSGRVKDWLKIKCVDRQDFWIAGYIPAKRSAEAVGSLVLGEVRGKKLVYVGRVGTGFTDRMAHRIWTLLMPLRREDPPFEDGVPRGQASAALWVEPKLVAEVVIGGWAADGLIRHAAFKGLREDKSAVEIETVTGELLSKSRAASSPRRGGAP